MKISSMIVDAYKTNGLLVAIRFCICILPALSIILLILVLRTLLYLIAWFVNGENPEIKILDSII